MIRFSKLQVRRQGLRVFNAIAVIFLFTALFSCATGSLIITGTKRPAISASEVKLYLEPPTEYETVGIVNASGDVEFSEQAAQNRVLNKLKSQAAKVGANGMLLFSTETKSVETDFLIGGVFYPISTKKIAAQAKAIYVIKE